MAAAISQDDYLNDTSAFDLQRKKAAQQSASDLQTQKDAMARRFAALGNLDSGAQIKQEQIAQDQSNQNLNSANESINAAQNSELGRRREVVQGQQFQSGEAQKGRDFSSGEAEKGRQFSTAERLGGQQFAAGQAGEQRAYGTSERIAGQGFASGEAQKGREFTTGERLGGQQFAAGQAGDARKFATAERVGGQDFASQQNAKNRQFQASQTKAAQQIQQEQFLQTYGLQKQQMEDAQKNFEKTYPLEAQAQGFNEELAQQMQKTAAKGGFLEQFGSNFSTSGLGNRISSTLHNPFG